MMRALAVLQWEFNLQRRYYFWWTALVITLMWVLLMSAVGDSVRSTWIPVLIFADICNIGLLFIAGILYLERRQGTLFVSAIMPVHPAHWLTAKLVSLTVLTSLCGLLIVLFGGGAVSWLRILPATLISAALFITLGFLLAVSFDRILNYFLVMSLTLSLLNLPILQYLGVVTTPLMWLLPSQAAMQLLADSYGDTPITRFLALCVLALSWTVLLHWLGVRCWQRLVRQRAQM